VKTLQNYFNIHSVTVGAATAILLGLASGFFPATELCSEQRWYGTEGLKFLPSDPYGIGLLTALNGSQFINSQLFFFTFQ
jgi:hypothetical protein